MTQSFVPTPDTDKHPENVDVITDAVEHGEEIVYQTGTGTDHASVTHSPLGAEDVFSEHPGSFMTRRLPRKPLIGGGTMFTRQLFNDGNPIPLLSRNINRYKVRLWVDPGAAGALGPAVTIGFTGQGGQQVVTLPLNGFPLVLESCEMLWASTTVANAVVHVVEEEYIQDSRH